MIQVSGWKSLLRSVLKNRVNVYGFSYLYSKKIGLTFDLSDNLCSGLDLLINEIFHFHCLGARSVSPTFTLLIEQVGPTVAKKAFLGSSSCPHSAATSTG